MVITHFKPCPPYLQKYIDYINNTSGIDRSGFEDDFSPIGKQVLTDLKSKGLIYEITKQDMEPSDDCLKWIRPLRLGIFLRPDLCSHNVKMSLTNRTAYGFGKVNDPSIKKWSFECLSKRHNIHSWLRTGTTSECTCCGMKLGKEETDACFGLTDKDKG